MHRAKEAAEHLPATLEHLPGNAALLQARAGAAGAAAREQTKRGLAGLAGLGSKLVLSTHDLLEQIKCGHATVLPACMPLLPACLHP